LVPPNEWGTADTINRSFRKLITDLEYLSGIAQLYDVPPTEFYGWLGNMVELDNTNEFYWRVNQPGLSMYYDQPDQAINGSLYNVQGISVRRVDEVGDNIHIIARDTKVSILSSDFRGTEINYVSAKGVGDDFVNIVAVDTDVNFETDHRIYMLDKLKNRVLVYSYNFVLNTWRLLFDWGGIGGPNAHNKFNGPTDLIVDKYNKLWLVDRNNRCIKKFSRTGSWIQTIQSDYFTDQNLPQSVAIADDDTIHVLCTNQIVKFSSDGEFIEVYTINELSLNNPIRIRTCKDGGFFYVLCIDKVLKITQTGELIGIFADDYNLTYTDICHDDHRNLYLTTTNSIVKYIDKLTIINLSLDTNNLMWPTSAIFIDRDEYQQDWVLNKSFARLYDNIEVFRRSLLGKFAYTIDDNGIANPIVRGFTPTEYELLPYDKGDIFVGVNELVTVDVFNRCIKQLYESLEAIKRMLDD